MEYRQLGKTDLIVSRICFGCWQLSPRFWGEVPLEPWHAALKKSIDLGVNFIDTADAYGDGYAEDCLGDYLKKEGIRDEFLIATKFYWNFQGKERHPDTRHEYILRECEDSLKRLKTDVIDLYQIHAFDPLTRPEEVAAAFGQLKKEGKVRWFGVSNLNSDQMRMYLQYFDIECLQPQYSLLARTIEERELPFCLEKKIGAIAFSPLYRGLLTGKYDKDHKFEDTRKDAPLFNGKAFHRILDALAEVKTFADELGLTVPQLAIRWILTHPAMTSAIVGIKTEEHLATICPAADEELPIEVWNKVATIMATAKKEAEAM